MHIVIISFDLERAIKLNVNVKGIVRAVCVSRNHTFSKQVKQSISLIEGIGVLDDAHSGRTVKHRSRVKRDPTIPNLRQVHLIHSELFDELSEIGFQVSAGELGENITTSGIDLLSLPKGTHLKIGGTVILEVTGLRNPCKQLDLFRNGLMKAVLSKDKNGGLVRKSGIMSVVVQGGEIRQDDPIEIVFPIEPYLCLEPV